MMEDADDQHIFTFYPVKNAMLPMREAIFVYLAQVRDGRIGKLYFSHALPAVWR